MMPATAATQEPAAQPATGEKRFVEARGSVRTVRLPPGGPTPRMADGRPDLSGVWFPGPTGKANNWSIDPEPPVQEDPIPWQPWAEAKRKAMSRIDVELSSATVNCRPVGTPGMFSDNQYAHQIIAKPGLFVHLIERNNRWHVVRTDGRPHKPKEELEPLYFGDQSARWEGDTLVIDSISIDTRAHIRDGWFHSEQLHVIERIRRPSMNFLEYQFTIEDPLVLTRPWTSAWATFSLSANDEDLLESFCTNNENVGQLEKLNAIEKTKK
jgi:hypothetical protein